MKVLVCARLFSGMVDSIQTGKWPPSGVPAIYKLLEGLHADPDVRLLTVLTVKDPYENQDAFDRNIELKQVGSVRVLPWIGRRFFGRFGLAGIVRELDHLIRFLWITLIFRPDVCYMTNANFPLAAVCARLGLAPVIMRFLGIHPVQKALADRANGLQWRLYQSRFAKAVCSLDGSGGAHYLPRLLHPEVPLSMILNGVDPIAPDPQTVQSLRQRLSLSDAPVVLFVGRLEPNKGILEFLDAVLAVRKSTPVPFDAIVVGDGSLRQQAENRADGANIRFTGAVAHADVAAILSMARVYVSLNRFGSLSNANLEAAAAGVCLIALEPDPSDATDLESFDVFPDGSIIRVPRNRIVDSLVASLTDLLENPDEIDRYAQSSRSVALSKFRSWDDRVAQEIEVIKSIANHRDAPIGENA